MSGLTIKKKTLVSLASAVRRMGEGIDCQKCVNHTNIEATKVIKNIRTLSPDQVNNAGDVLSTMYKTIKAIKNLNQYSKNPALTTNYDLLAEINATLRKDMKAVVPYLIEEGNKELLDIVKISDDVDGPLEVALMTKRILLSLTIEI